MQARSILIVLALAVSYAAAEICAGCPMNQDPSQFNKEKLSQVLSSAGSNEVVAKIVSVSTQVVAGVRYVVVFETTSGKTCQASWVEAPWESGLPEGVQFSCRAKRSIFSGFQDVDEQEMADIVAYGEAVANDGVNGNLKAVVKIIKAQKQVVQGTVYKIEYIVKTTSCKLDAAPEEACLEKEVAPRETCKSVIFVSPYMLHGRHQHQVMTTACKTVVGGRLITGHDQEDMEYAKHFAVSHANQQINSMVYKGLYKLISVDESLSAGGKLYTFKFVLRDTDCKKNKDFPLNSENCPLKTSNHTMDDLCSVTVWYLPYTKYVQYRAGACASTSL